MNRYFVTALVPLVDFALFSAFIAHGAALQSSHIASFCLAMALNCILKVRSTSVAGKPAWDWRRYLKLASAALMALFLRGGVLGLLSLTLSWPPRVAIVFAILAGWAVSAPGYAFALSQAADTSRQRRRALAIGLILYAFALRWVYAGSVELLPEETYYWNYARHLDIGYLDHPPMVAWLIRLGTALFGQSEFGVRTGALGCGIVTAVFAYRLTRNLYGETSALAAVVLAQVLPFFFLSGLLLTPDAPLTAAWAAALYYLERALVAGRRAAWWGAGVSLGLGMISKYSIGLLVPVIFVFMVWDRPARSLWRRWEPYAAALAAIAIFSPVLWWNARHDWASFAFQTSRRLAEAPRFALHRLFASALVLITPTGVLAVAAALFSPAPPGSPGAPDTGDGGARRRRRFINLAVLLPLAVFALFSLRHEVKLDWTGAPWVAALPLMAAGMISYGANIRGLAARIRNAWMPTLITVLLIFGAGLHYLVLGLPGVGYGRHIELVPVGWREFSRQVRAAAASVPDSGGAPLIVGMDRYAIASELAFYGLKDTKSTLETSSAHLFDGIGLMYERWTPATREEGRTLLLVAWDPGDISGESVERHAERWGPIVDEVLTRDGQVVRHYYHRLAYNYRRVPR